MRMSCNGCRVLRKGCSEDCSIRPCLQWIKDPDSQGHATVFLAKFYGRAGLVNLLRSGPQHLRPAIFRSLLYEACGRIVNPTYGSVGLLWSGNWQLVQSAVDSVLIGQPVIQINADTAAKKNPKFYVMRQVSKESNPCDVQKVQNRTRFKRPTVLPKPRFESAIRFSTRPGSPDSASVYSVETMEASLVNPSKPDCFTNSEGQQQNEVELDLTLRLDPVRRTHGRNSWYAVSAFCFLFSIFCFLFSVSYLLGEVTT